MPVEESQFVAFFSSFFKDEDDEDDIAQDTGQAGPPPAFESDAEGAERPVESGWWSN